jgi:hypothetical protein
MKQSELGAILISLNARNLRPHEVFANRTLQLRCYVLEPHSLRVADQSNRIPVMAGTSPTSPGAETAGKTCCVFDSQVDRAFLVAVLLISTAQKFLGAVRHEQLPPKFSSNTHLAKGVLCPEN